MNNKPREIELYIEELVLDGFDSSERHTIAEALKLELETLLRDSPLVLDSVISELHLDRLNAGSITLKAGERSDRLGAQVGRALFQSVSNVTRPGMSSAQNEKGSQSVRTSQGAE